MWSLIRNILLTAAGICGTQAYSQTAWNWTLKTEMPFKVANNAVASGEMGGNKYVYSFGGIDSTKVWTGQTRRSFRYNVVNDQWDEIDSLPVTLPLIASSASTVNNKIYIIGGYHVYSSGNETSSNEVIIYNPETNAFESNGANIPVPIDDQVQCVWRDSLIFVVTGWSNTGNVDDVQIYDPAIDQWQAGTAVPNQSPFKVFGASGEIIGDTIYYYGGASNGWNFPALPFIRKGVIDPADPTQITWTQLLDAPVPNYRSACVKHNNDIFWIGGSEVSYNYNAMAYNGSGGVAPNFKIMRYQTYYNDWYEGTGSPHGVMDLRGAGQVSANEWIICGGIDTSQSVTNRTLLLTYDPITGSTGSAQDSPRNIKIVNRTIYFETPVQDAKLIGLDGKLVSELKETRIEDDLSGYFILETLQNGRQYHQRILVR